MRPRVPRLVVAVLAGLALAAPVAARPRVELILLAKGDRVTGEIVRLEASTLTVRTLAFGTVDVDWPDVVGLVSPQLFEVERADGARFVGQLAVGEEGGVLRVARGEGEPLEIPLSRVVGIDQRGSNLWTSRRGYVDLGSTFSQADSDTTLTLEAELALKGKRFRWVNTVSATVSDDANDVQRQREVLQSVVEIPLGRRFLLFAMGQHERNDDLGLRARDSLGGVVAWLPVNGPRGRIVLGPGATESREAYSSRDETSSVTSGAFLLAGEYHRFGGSAPGRSSRSSGSPSSPAPTATASKWPPRCARRWAATSPSASAPTTPTTAPRPPPRPRARTGAG